MKKRGCKGEPDGTREKKKKGPHTKESGRFCTTKRKISRGREKKLSNDSVL